MDAERQTRMGIVTDVDDQYNYVWSDLLGPSELRYPLNPDVKFEPGEIINYIQTMPDQCDQDLRDLRKEDPQSFDHYSIEKTPGFKECKWRVQVYLTFAPHDSEQYKKTMEKDQEHLRGVAYAEDFLFLTDQLMMVPCYSKKIQYEEGAVYKAYIGRIPKGYDSLALKIGSIFLILEKGLHKVTDEQTVQRVLRQCPWNKTQSNIFGCEGDDEMPSEVAQISTTSMRQNNQIGIGTNSMSLNYTNEPPPYITLEKKRESSIVNEERERPPHKFENKHDAPRDERERFYQDEPLSEHYSEARALEEGEEHLGLIVRCEPEYSVIWSRQHDLVRVQIGYNEYRQNPQNQPVWPLCTWVFFRCFEELSELHRNTRCQFTAYDIRKATREPTQVRQLAQGNVAVKLTLTNLTRHSNEYFLAEDPFFGKVLCSGRDHFFVAQMIELNEAQNAEFTSNFMEPLEALAIYVERYKFSKWVVFMIRIDDKWKRVGGLPPFIEEAISTEVQKPKMKPAEYREEQAQAHRATEDAINEEQQQPPDNVFYEPPEWRNDNHQQQQHESSSSSLDNNEAPVPVTRTIRKTQANQEGEPQEQNPFSAIGPGPRKLYNPLDNEEHKREYGLVVEKHTDYAILYNYNHGHAIAINRYCPSREHFDSLFELGRFVGANFARVANYSGPDNILTYQYMCLPKFRPVTKQIFPVRTHFGKYIQAYYECDFHRDNICLQSEGLFAIDSDLGRVVIKHDILKHNDLLGKVVKCWITHVTRCGSYSWEITPTEKSHWDIDPNYNKYKLDDLVIIHDRQNHDISIEKSFEAPATSFDREFNQQPQQNPPISIIDFNEIQSPLPPVITNKCDQQQCDENSAPSGKSSDSYGWVSIGTSGNSIEAPIVPLESNHNNFSLEASQQHHEEILINGGPNVQNSSSMGKVTFSYSGVDMGANKQPACNPIGWSDDSEESDIGVGEQQQQSSHSSQHNEPSSHSQHDGPIFGWENIVVVNNDRIQKKEAAKPIAPSLLIDFEDLPKEQQQQAPMARDMGLVWRQEFEASKIRDVQEKKKHEEAERARKTKLDNYFSTLVEKNKQDLSIPRNLLD